MAIYVCTVPPDHQSASFERPEVPVPERMGKWPMCTQSAHLAPPKGIPKTGARAIRPSHGPWTAKTIGHLCHRGQPHFQRGPPTTGH